MSAMTFRELVQAEYINKGETLFQAKCLIHRESGVSMGTLRRAYDGTRIQPDSVEKLIEWCARKFPGVELGFVALMTAPKKERAAVDWGARALRAIEHAIREAGVPEGLSVRVTTPGANEDRWSAELWNGAQTITTWGDTLPTALALAVHCAEAHGLRPLAPGEHGLRPLGGLVLKPFTVSPDNDVEREEVAP